MDKGKSIERFTRRYTALTETEKNGFSRIANKLLSNSFICESKDNDRSDYYEALQRVSLYQDYFTVLEYEVILHANEKVIQLKSTEKYNHYNLKLNESVLLLLLRKIYAAKAKEISLHENIIVSIEEVHNAVEEIGFLNRRMNKSDFRDVIRLFKRFSLLDNIGDIEQDDSMLVLYPSITFAAPYEDLLQIDTAIRNYGREEQSDETIDEDPAD